MTLAIAVAAVIVVTAGLIWLSIVKNQGPSDPGGI
jgi:hypothetical protein